MPAQTPVSVGTAYYSQNDTNPPLRRQLKEGDGSAIDLTAATTVTITIGFQRDFHYYSPKTPIVLRGSCDIDGDPTTGYVDWIPGVGDLSIPGSFHFIFEINWSDGTRQTVPAHTYETLVITTKPGGFETL